MPNLKIIGRNVLYVEGIKEFLDEVKEIEQVIISIDMYKSNEIFIDEINYKYKNVKFIIIYVEEKEIKNYLKYNITFLEKEYFIQMQKENFNLEEKNMEQSLIEIDMNKIQNINLQEKQNKFLESTLGKVINSAIDLGIKSILPDLIEDEVIDVKNAILENGFKEGLNTIINSSINLGKSAIGIFTGNFENISQVREAVKTGGLIDSISVALDSAIKFAKQKNLIDSTMANLIKQGKNTIMKSVTSKIEEELTSQIEAAEKIEIHCNKWKENYERQDFNSMENNLKNIEKYLNKITPIESAILQARTIQNLHALIKNNGKNFELSDTEKLLAEKLAM